MTTSHRPQLEARSGAKGSRYVPTSTEHARLLPGHKKIKYRDPITIKGKDKAKHNIGKDINDNIGPIVSEKNYLENTGLNDLKKVLSIKDVDTQDTSDMSSNSSSSSDNYSDDEDDEEEEMKQLQKELALLKQKQLPKEKKEELYLEEDNKDVKMPISQFKRKSWRQGTTFSRDKTKISKRPNQSSTNDRNKSKNYINNITQSVYHQEFMKKFVK